MGTVVTRMGDGSTVRLTRDEIRRDIVEGSEAAAVKAKVPVLEENEVDYLVDMFCCPSRVWGVERGHEAVMTKDGGTNTLISSRLSSGIAAPIAKVPADANAACTGRALSVSEIPSSSRACAPNASCFINWSATWLASIGSSPRFS